MKEPFFLIAVLMLAGTAYGQSPVPSQLEPCVSIRRDAERLACFDRAIAALRTGSDAPAPTAENMFGVTESRAPADERAQVEKREELRRIQGSITSMSRTDDGMIILELDNGQVWRQQDSAVKLSIGVGDTVTITRAAMGTFRIADNSGRFARFKRVR